LNQSLVELPKRWVGQRVDRRCFVCEQQLRFGAVKCSECNLQMHLHCLLIGNVNRVFEAESNEAEVRLNSVRVSQVSETGDHLHLFCPEERLEESIRACHSQLSQLELMSRQALNALFAQTSNRHLSSYNRSFSASPHFEYRCGHHSSPQTVKRFGAGECINCGSGAGNPSQPGDKAVCDKCRALKRLTQFEAETDFAVHKAAVMGLQSTVLSMYDLMLLGRTFYDRLVFITPDDAESSLHLAGFKSMKTKLVGSLTSEFIEGLFKALKREGLCLAVRDEGRFASVTVMRDSAQMMAGKLSGSALQRDALYEKPMGDTVEFLRVACGRLDKLLDCSRPVRKVLRTMAKLAGQKELRKSVFEECFMRAEIEIEGVMEAMKERLDSLFNRTDSLSYVYLRLRETVAEVLQSKQAQLETTPLLGVAVISFLAEAGLVDNTRECLGEYERATGNKCKALVDRMSLRLPESNIASLQPVLPVLLEQLRSTPFFLETPEGQQALSAIAQFESQTASYFASVQHYDNRKPSLLQSMVDSGVLKTQSQAVEFLSANHVFCGTTDYAKLSFVVRQSQQANSVFESRLDTLLRTLTGASGSLQSQLRSVWNLLSDSLSMVNNTNLLVDTGLLRKYEALRQFKHVLMFVEGKQVSPEKLQKSIDGLMSGDSESGRALTDPFDTWLSRVRTQVQMQLVNEVIPKVREESAAIERFRHRVFGTFFSNETVNCDMSTAEIDAFFASFSHAESESALGELVELADLRVLVEAIRRTLSMTKTEQGSKVMELLRKLLAVPRWAEAFRRSCRMDKLARIVEFLLMSRVRKPEVETVFRFALKQVLERRLSDILAESPFSTAKIEEFQRLLSFSSDESYKAVVGEYKFLKAFHSLCGSLGGLFLDRLNQSNLLLFVSPAELAALVRVARNSQEGGDGQGGVVTEDKQSIATVRVFIRNLSDVLDKASKFQRSGSLFTVVDFLKDCLQKSTSLGLLMTLMEGNAEAWKKTAERHQVTLDSLSRCIADVADVQMHANSSEIEGLLERSRQFRDNLGLVAKLVKAFDGRQSREMGGRDQGLVSLKELQELKERLKVHKAMCPKEYEGVKSRVNEVRVFEKRLVGEAEGLSEKCGRLARGEQTESGRRVKEGRLEEHFLGVRSAEVSHSPAFKDLRSAYFETRKAYYCKSFTSALVSFNMPYYHALYELYKVLVLPKTKEQLGEFVGGFDLEGYGDSAADNASIGVLRQLMGLVETVTGKEEVEVGEKEVEVGEKEVEESWRLRAVFGPGLVVSTRDSHTARLNGLLALRHLVHETEGVSAAMKARLTKAALFGVLSSGLKVSECLMEGVSQGVVSELRLARLSDRVRGSPPHHARFVVGSYRRLVPFDSERLESLTDNYLNQLDKLLSARTRVLTDCLKDTQLSTERVLECFGCAQAPARKVERLKSVCDRTCVTKFALVCQLRGFGQVNSLNMTIQGLLDFDDSQGEFDAHFPVNAAERDKMVEVSCDTLCYPRAFRRGNAEKGLLNLVSELRAVELMDNAWVVMTRLAVVFSVWLALGDNGLCLKVREYRVLLSELRALVETVKGQPQLTDGDRRRVVGWLREVWLFVSEVLREAERYVATLRSLTIDVEEVFRHKSIVSTSELIEGIHDFSSKSIEAMDPFRGVEADGVESTGWDEGVFFEIEQRAFEANDESFRAYEESMMVEMGGMQVDWQSALREEVAVAVKRAPTPNDRRLRNVSSGANNDSKERSIALDGSGDSVHSVKAAPDDRMLVEESIGREDIAVDDGSAVQGSFIDVSDDLSEAREGRRKDRLGTLGAFLGQVSYWKSFQKAVKRNPRLSAKMSPQNIVRFVKRMESSFESLRFLFADVSEESLETFLANFKDINELIDRFNAQKLSFQGLVDLVNDPGKRLKSSKRKAKAKDTKQTRADLLNEVYGELDQRGQGTGEGDKAKGTGVAESVPTLGKREGQAGEEDRDRALLEAIQIKRVKQSEAHPARVFSLSRLVSPLVERVLFLDDRDESGEKATIPIASMFTCETPETVAQFPDLARQVKFKTSEFKKKVAELQKEYLDREQNRATMMLAFCFIPVNKLPNGFYGELERASVCGFAAAPELQVFLAHSSSLNHDFFQGLGLYYQGGEEQQMHDLFVVFLRKVEGGPQGSNRGEGGERGGRGGTGGANDRGDALDKGGREHPGFGVSASIGSEVVEEFEAADDQVLVKRRKEIVQEHLMYLQAYGFARYLRMHPRIYFKMGSEILKNEQTYMVPRFPQMPIPPSVDPFHHPIGHRLPSDLNSRMFSELGYATFPQQAHIHPPMLYNQAQETPGYINQGFPRPDRDFYANPQMVHSAQTTHHERQHQQRLGQVHQAGSGGHGEPGRLMFDFTDANEEEVKGVSLLPGVKDETEELEEIVSLIQDLELGDLFEYFKEADEELRDSIRKALKKTRGEEYELFEQMVSERMRS
jgi:hypothetical protein